MAASPIPNSVHPICTICFDEVHENTDTNEEEDKIRLLPCEHIFHEECIKHWEKFDISNVEGDTCPNCKEIFKPASFKKRMSKTVRRSASRVGTAFARTMSFAVCH